MPAVPAALAAGEGTQCAPGRPFNRASPDEGMPVNKTARVQPLPPCLARRGSWTSSLALWDLPPSFRHFRCVIQKSISKTKIRNTRCHNKQTASKQCPRRCLSGIANGTGRCPADSFNGQHHRLLFDLVSPTTVQVLPSRRPCLARAGTVRWSSYRCTARKKRDLRFRYDSGREDRARRRPPDDRDSAHLSPSSRRCRKRCRGIRFLPTAHEDSAVDLQPPRGTASTLDRIRPPIPIM